VSIPMVMERRAAGTALVRLPENARALAGRPWARSTLARYLTVAAVLLSVAYLAGAGRANLPAPAVWEYQRETVDLQGGGPATAYARWSIRATAWAARTSIERQRDVFRYSALETRLGGPAATAIAGFRQANRLPLQGTTVVALAALVFYGLLRRRQPAQPARPSTRMLTARLRRETRAGTAAPGGATAGTAATAATITDAGAVKPSRKAISGKASNGKAISGGAAGGKAGTGERTGAKPAGASASASKAGAKAASAKATGKSRAGTRAGTRAGNGTAAGAATGARRAAATGASGRSRRPAAAGAASDVSGSRDADTKALGADALAAPAAWQAPRNLWVIAVLLLLAGTLAVTKPQTVLVTAGAPGDTIQASSALVLGLADPTRQPNARGSEPTQRELSARYWIDFVGAPLSRLQTGSRVLADAPPERKSGLLGALTSQIDVVRAWAAGARGVERIVIATFSLLYVLPFALLLWVFAMVAAIAQALLLLLALAGLAAVPLSIEPRWRGMIRRWWLVPFLGTAALLAVASLASLGALRLAAVIRGADEYIGMLLAGSLLPALAVALIVRRARRGLQARARAGTPGSGPGELGAGGDGGPAQPGPQGDPDATPAPAAAGPAGTGTDTGTGTGRSRRSARRTALGGAA
jgi:hypothetical protein